MKQIKRNKLSTNFSPEPMKVIQIQGSQVTAEHLNDKKVFTRNMCFFNMLILRGNPPHSCGPNIDWDIKNIYIFIYVYITQGRMFW